MTQGKEFTIVRDFDASPELLWKAWTNADDAAQWWHPRNVSVARSSVSIDARAGGTYAYTMVNDATGDEYPTVGTFLEVVEHERLVLTWGNPGEPVDEAPVITVTLEPLGDRTRMTFHLRGHDGYKGDAYIYDGWDQALDILGEVLARS